MEKQSQLTIVKRDGSKEPFDANKIARVVQAAGLDQDQATRLAEEVENEVKTNQELTSLQIRDIVSEKLKNVDEYAAGLYDWYQKTKPEKTV